MKKTVILYALLTLTLLNGSSVESEIGINMGVNSTKNDGGSQFKNPSVAVTLQYNNYVVMPRFDLEYVKLNNESASSLVKGSMNGVYDIENRTYVTPYLLAGVGYEHVQGSTKDVFESHPFVQGGGGLKVNLPKDYKLNVEGRFLQILGGNNEENEAIITAGVSIPFERSIIKRPKTRVVRQIIRPRRPIVVRPLPVPISPTRIVYVNNNECKIKTNLPDLDRDGVEDRRDQCPNTPCNFSVDGYGCPVKTTLKVHFKSNSSQIINYSIGKVNYFADFLLKNKGSRITIIGHTDSFGSNKKNLLLSERRANSIVRALINRGISPARLSAVGRGETMPIASNKTVEGRAMNRRIEANLSYPKGRR